MKHLYHINLIVFIFIFNDHYIINHISIINHKHDVKLFIHYVYFYHIIHYIIKYYYIKLFNL